MSSTKKMFFTLAALFMFALVSCEDKDPSILRVYVKSSDHILLEGAFVRIVGDISKDTPEYMEEKKTDESGAAVFNLDELFDSYDKKAEKVAYFNVFARDTTLIPTSDKARAKANLTSTVTIVLQE